MTREIQAPTTDEHGDETHPAFAMMSVHRIRATPGQVLFDSDLRHDTYMEVTLTQATRKRDLKHDWIHPGKVQFQVAMSMAQFAAFVSSTDSSGVPVTLTRTPDGDVPGLPYEPRLAIGMAETKQAAQEAFAGIAQAFDAYQAALLSKPPAPAKERNAALAKLKAAIANATPNVDYAGKQLARLAEDVTEKARADIEAMVAAATAAASQNTPALEDPEAQAFREQFSITGPPPSPEIP